MIVQVGAFDDIMIDDTTSKFGRGTTYNSIPMWHIVDGGGLECMPLLHS